MKENGVFGRESGRGCDGTNERCIFRSIEWFFFVVRRDEGGVGVRAFEKGE